MPTAAAGTLPPGSEVVPFELRNGLIHVRATVRAGASEVSGWLVFDTGAPSLVLTASSWASLQRPDRGESMAKRSFLGLRPLSELRLGDVVLKNPEIANVAPDRLLDADVIGLFPPGLFADCAVAIDYESRRLTIVHRNLTVMERPTGGRGGDPRVNQSRARYAAALSERCVAVPFRLFDGGRMLVRVRAEDPARAWRSATMTLLLDTGASACVLFDDAVAEFVPGVRSWPLIPGLRARTMLGETRADFVLLPSLALLDATTPLSEPRIEVGTQARRSLPDIQGELPDPVHGLLGYSFLNRFRIVIDYPNRVLWLEPRTQAGAVTRSGGAARTEATATLDLALGTWGGTLRVLTVTPGTPSAAAGLEYGDIVVSIDGTRTAGLGEDAIERLLTGRPRSEAVLVVKRGGMERVVRIARNGAAYAPGDRRVRPPSFRPDSAARR